MKMSIHKARKKVANEKWLQISLQICGISEQALGSRYADGLYQGLETPGFTAASHMYLCKPRNVAATEL